MRCQRIPEWKQSKDSHLFQKNPNAARTKQLRAYHGNLEFPDNIPISYAGIIPDYHVIPANLEKIPPTNAH
jgi:hypothetical protein